MRIRGLGEDGRRGAEKEERERRGGKSRGSSYLFKIFRSY